jgi:serine/threonine protein kinase
MDAIRHSSVNGFVILQLAELLLAFVATSVVLPALSRNHRRFRSARHSLFFSVVFTDLVFASIGVVHHVTLVGQGGHAKLTRSLAGVVLDALFQLAFVAMLLWPPVLAMSALRPDCATFLVKLSWQVTWLIAGAYGALWTRALQRDRSPQNWNVTGYALSVILIATTAIVVAAAAVLYARKLSYKKVEIPEQKLLQYLVAITTLQLPFALANWLGSAHFPQALADIALALVLLVPTLNAYNYGSPATFELMQDKRARTRTGGGTRTTVMDDLVSSMDPDNVTLEELDGISDMTFLAEGASGSVYKARWLGIDVAMKLIKLPNVGAQNDLYQTIIQNSEAAFLAEASICARLRHPNITLFIRAGHYEGKLGILTEFCHHGSLKDVLKKQFPLQWKRKVSLALDVAKGLTYLHARNPTYIHRDLKASNILVTDTWQAKLADFGISKVANFVPKGNGEGGTTRGTETVVGVANGGDFDAHTMTLRTMNESTSFAGTWRWNAPEVLRDPTNCRYSRSTDMYSFGMVLWEILSDGAIPFSDVRFDFEVRERVLNDERPQIMPSVGCPDAFISLILQCWSHNTKTRPTAPQAATQLTQILESMGGKHARGLESIDSSSRDGNSIFTDQSSIRSTFATRITSMFRGGLSQRATAASQQSSSRGVASSRGFFPFRSGGPSETSEGGDDDDTTNKFAILGSPGPRSSRSRTSSSSSGTSLYTGTRGRGFSKEKPLPSVTENDSEPPALLMETGNMSPIVELPMDAMLEDGGPQTYMDDPLLGTGTLETPAAPSLPAPEQDDDYDEMARTLPVKYPKRLTFPRGESQE